jgi:hypothetical protein
MASLDDGRSVMSYVGYCAETHQAINVGDLVQARDEWGYWQRDYDAHVGRVVSSHGWLTIIERADGSTFAADGHTTRLVHAPDRDQGLREARVARAHLYRVRRRLGFSRELTRKLMRS